MPSLGKAIEKKSVLDQNDIEQMIEEINNQEEVDRRAHMLRRGRIYADGGKSFLIEELKKEFGSESLNEMRLAPLNLLKKIVNKRSTLYKQAPIRKATTDLDSDQVLIDFYTQDLDFNEMMDKAHRYFTLYSNVALYPYPVGDKIAFRVIPPYQYSVTPNKIDPTISDVWVFNRFVEEGDVTPQDSLLPAGGGQGFGRERGFKTKDSKIDSMQKQTEKKRTFIFWTDAQHFTVDEDGELLMVDSSGAPIEEQIVNPIEMSPVVNLAKDRDGQFWATQFADTVELSIAVMKAWTDILTIAKHHGFSILTVVSEEEPKQLTIGINRAVWLKQKPDGPQPSINYVQASSPLAEYKDLIMELTGLILSTADINPKEISGSSGGASFSSGFQALIETSDTLEARKRDQNPLRRAEQQTWEIIKRWHNWMLDTDQLNPEARALGKFSDDFGVMIEFADVKPLESLEDRIKQVRELKAEGLVTRRDAMKRLHPDMNEEQIDMKLEAIDAEMKELSSRAATLMGAGQPEVEV